MLSFDEFRLVLLALCVIGLLIIVVPCALIVRRRGLPIFSALLILLPVINVALVYWFAYASGTSSARNQ